MNYKIMCKDYDFYRSPFSISWEQRELWTLTIWDKKFNEVEKEKQPKVIKYPYVLADVFNDIEDNSGDVLLLSTGSYVGYTTEEKAGSNLCNGEVVAIPWGGSPNVKYFQGKFVTADNRIATSNNTQILENKYLYYWLLSNIRKLENIYRGASIKHPSMSDVLNLILTLPISDEQQKIIEMLSNLDNLITLHLRKRKRKLKQKLHKKHAQKLAISWEQRKVSELANRFDNLRIPVTASDRISGTTPYYGANGIQDYVTGFTHNGEFILVAEDGANDLQNYPVQYVKGQIWVNNHAHVLQNKENLSDNKFLKYSISNSNIEAVLVGGGRAKLNSEALMNISLFVPNQKEQKQLGDMFYKLDNLITLHQCKYFCPFDKNIHKNHIFKVRKNAITWEQRKFENIFNYERPDAYIVKSDKYSDEYKTPVLTANKGFILGYTNETSTHNGPCIIFDDFTLDSKYVNFDFMVKSSAIKILNVKDGYILRFAYERLNSEKLENLGHARHYISVVQPTETLMPKIAEQEKISKLFTFLENSITLHLRL